MSMSPGSTFHKRKRNWQKEYLCMMESREEKSPVGRGGEWGTGVTLDSKDPAPLQVSTCFGVTLKMNCGVGNPRAEPE